MGQGGAVLLLLLAGAGLWRVGAGFGDRLLDLFAIESAEPVVDSRALVISQIQGASELTTAIYTMEAVVPTSRDRVIGDFVVGRTELLYIAHGEVRAGVDLSALDPSRVTVTEDTLTLQLPPPQILDHKIDVSRSRVFSYRRGLLGPDAAVELQSLAQQETLNRIVAAACENGVLQQASDRAVVAVTQLLTTAGYDSPVVQIQPAEAGGCAIAPAAPAPPPQEVLPPPSPALPPG